MYYSLLDFLINLPSGGPLTSLDFSLAQGVSKDSDSHLEDEDRSRMMLI